MERVAEVAGENSFGAVVVTFSFGALTGAGTDAGATCYWWNRFGNLNNFNIGVTWLRCVGYTHVVQAVIVGDVLVVEPRAVAGLPWSSTHHAELSCAATMDC